MNKLLLTIFLITASCANLPRLTPTVTPTLDSLQSSDEITLPAAHGFRGGWYELYFTDPNSPLAATKTGGADGPLVASLDATRLSIDVAAYSLSLDSVRDALIRAQRRGVRVRLVMESDNLDGSDPKKLIAAGIPVVGDEQPGLMHDKFIVLDDAELWTGSMNFTDSGAYRDNNNLIHIHSLQLAQDYAAEFDEMFVQHKFGDAVARTASDPRVTISGTPIEVYFSPDNKVQDRLVELITSAKHSIDFLAFSFTADPLGEAVRARARAGAQVRGVMESDQVDTNIGTEFDPFKQAGLDVRRDGNAGLMHHKVLIIDGGIVVLGSYNFTNSAELRNDENLLVVNNSDIAAQFTQEFQRVFAQAH